MRMISGAPSLGELIRFHLDTKNSQNISTLSLSKENFPNILKIADGLKEIGDRHGATAGQVALAWVLAQGDDIIPIPGTTKVPVSIRFHSMKNPNKRLHIACRSLSKRILGLSMSSSLRRISRKSASYQRAQMRARVPGTPKFYWECCTGTLRLFKDR